MPAISFILICGIKVWAAVSKSICLWRNLLSFRPIQTRLSICNKPENWKILYSNLAEEKYWQSKVSRLVEGLLWTSQGRFRRVRISWQNYQHWMLTLQGSSWTAWAVPARSAQNLSMGSEAGSVSIQVLMVRTTALLRPVVSLSRCQLTRVWKQNPIFWQSTQGMNVMDITALFAADIQVFSSTKVNSTRYLFSLVRRTVVCCFTLCSCRTSPGSENGLRVSFKSWMCAAGRLPGKKYFDHPDYAHINKMWHPTKNGDKGPGDFTHGTHQRVWLQCLGCSRCDQTHTWQARVQNLTRLYYKVGCPWCESRGCDGGRFCQCRSIKKNPR